jgi:hypothetical protein
MIVEEVQTLLECTMILHYMYSAYLVQGNADNTTIMLATHHKLVLSSHDQTV